jgi:hypothetical protein
MVAGKNKRRRGVSADTSGIWAGGIHDCPPFALTREFDTAEARPKTRLSPVGRLRKNDSTVLVVYAHGALYSNLLHSICAPILFGDPTSAQRGSSGGIAVREDSAADATVSGKGGHSARLRAALADGSSSMLVFAVPGNSRQAGRRGRLDKYESRRRGLPAVKDSCRAPTAGGLTRLDYGRD